MSYQFKTLFQVHKLASWDIIAISQNTVFPSDVFYNWLQLSQFNYLYRSAQSPLLQLHGVWFQMLSNAQVNDPSVTVVNKRVRQAVLDPVFKTAQHAENVLRNQEWNNSSEEFDTQICLAVHHPTAPPRPPALSPAHLPSVWFHVRISLLWLSQTLIIPCLCGVATLMIHKGVGSCFQKLGAGIAENKLKQKEQFS